MIFREAAAEDFPSLKALFTTVADNLNSRGIHIWDEAFPVCCLGEDIEKKRLYVLSEAEKIIAAFALTDARDDHHKELVGWEDNKAEAFYLYRLAVSPEVYKSGIGTFMLGEAERLTREKGGRYLRLYVADCNKPALAFYKKNGYTAAEGVIELDEFDFVLFGYEKRV